MTWATERLDSLKDGTAEPPPVVKTLRLGQLDDWGQGWAKKCWKPVPNILQSDGTMFGGYIAALADQMLAFAALSVVPEGYAFRTTNLSVQFFRIARGEEITIEARVVAQSRQLISVEAEFHSLAGKLFAKATAQQVIMPLR